MSARSMLAERKLCTSRSMLTLDPLEKLSGRINTVSRQRELLTHPSVAQIKIPKSNFLTNALSCGLLRRWSESQIWLTNFVQKEALCGSCCPMSKSGTGPDCTVVAFLSVFILTSRFDVGQEERHQTEDGKAFRWSALSCAKNVCCCHLQRLHYGCIRPRFGAANASALGG